MKLDISTIPVDVLKLEWLAPLCTTNRKVITGLIISKEQEEAIFGKNNKGESFTQYRSIPFEVKE